MSTTNPSPTPLNPERLARLSRGLLMTLRSLHSRSGGWESVAVDRTLAIQQFFKEFSAWIKEVEALTNTSFPNKESPVTIIDGDGKPDGAQTLPE